jgi:hypothetical protein
MLIAILGEDTFADFDLKSLRGGIIAGGLRGPLKRRSCCLRAV